MRRGGSTYSQALPPVRATPWSHGYIYTSSFHTGFFTKLDTENPKAGQTLCFFKLIGIHGNQVQAAEARK
ncbi:hypothetical protein QTJ16_003393 [Diplocarpon rosae]|uniref:Uncharacterized protein n=1 Tax=Diplocarpon rosae TaxID=946125 RepID=A0AAD9T2H1_9HELO|nr:hypothetical protein QTJ16_003393 [Diplocarpon rosae]